MNHSRTLSLFPRAFLAMAFMVSTALVSAAPSAKIVTVGDPQNPGALAPALQAGHAKAARHLAPLLNPLLGRQ